jgi:hypothetical protein
MEENGIVTPKPFDTEVASALKRLEETRTINIPRLESLREDINKLSENDTRSLISLYEEKRCLVLETTSLNDELDAAAEVYASFVWLRDELEKLTDDKLRFRVLNAAGHSANVNLFSIARRDSAFAPQILKGLADVEELAKIILAQNMDRRMGGTCDKMYRYSIDFKYDYDPGSTGWSNPAVCTVLLHIENTGGNPFHNRYTSHWR